MSSIRPITDSARGYPGVPTVVMLAAGKGSRVALLGNGRPKVEQDEVVAPVPREPAKPLGEPFYVLELKSPIPFFERVPHEQRVRGVVLEEQNSKALAWLDRHGSP